MVLATDNSIVFLSLISRHLKFFSAPKGGYLHSKTFDCKLLSEGNLIKKLPNAFPGQG